MFSKAKHEYSRRRLGCVAEKTERQLRLSKVYGLGFGVEPASKSKENNLVWEATRLVVSGGIEEESRVGIRVQNEDLHGH